VLREFEGRVAVVTGGGSGIGLALARRFAEEGMKVVLGVRVDVTKQEDVERLRDEAIERWASWRLRCERRCGGRGSR